MLLAIMKSINRKYQKILFVFKKKYVMEKQKEKWT